MTTLTVTIVTRPELKTAGLKVRTTMTKASQDCQALWTNEFCPRMESFPADPAYPTESYGLAIMVDSETFDYWTVMPLAPGAAVPEGMDSLTVPGGKYAECQLASLTQLSDAFMYIYGPWIAEQSSYALNMQGICYEVYTYEYMESGKITLYCPLIEK